MEDQQNSERSDHLDEIGSDPAIEHIRSMTLHSPLRVTWCTDPLLESLHLPFYHDTFYSSISTTVVSSPPDFDGFSDGLHVINTASSTHVTTYHLFGSYGSDTVVSLNFIGQQLRKESVKARMAEHVLQAIFGLSKKKKKSRVEVLQEQNEFLPGSNKSKMVYGSEEDNINVCHVNDPAGNLCGSSNHIDSLEARGSPKLTQLADLTTTAYSSFCSLGFTKPQTELLCSDRALKQPMATLPHVVPHVTTMKNAGIVTTLQNEPDNLMTAPCWGSANELEVHPPSLLLPCLTESTAQDNLAQPRSLTHHEAKSNGGELTQLTNYGEKIVSTNKSCIVIHHPEKKNTIETRKRNCRTDSGEDLPIEVTEFHNGKKLCSSQYGGGMVQLDASNQQSMDPTINSGRNGGSGEQCDNVVTHSQEKPKCKHRFQISLEDIQQHREKKRIDAANCLKVSQSTLKRICRDFGIDDWRKIKKDSHSLPIESVQGVEQEQILELSSNVPHKQAPATVSHTNPSDRAMQDANMVTIKAKYVNDIIIKFELSLPWRLVELQHQVANRLNLEAGTYYIKYKDADNDLILIACDDDLKNYICTCRSQGSSSIEVFLQLK